MWVAVPTQAGWVECMGGRQASAPTPAAGRPQPEQETSDCSALSSSCSKGWRGDPAPFRGLNFDRCQKRILLGKKMLKFVKGPPGRLLQVAKTSRQKERFAGALLGVGDSRGPCGDLSTKGLESDPRATATQIPVELIQSLLGDDKKQSSKTIWGKMEHRQEK